MFFQRGFNKIIQLNDCFSGAFTHILFIKKKKNWEMSFWVDSKEKIMRKIENLNITKFLEKKNGAYSTFRIINNVEIMLFEKHVKRLCFSFNSIIKKEALLYDGLFSEILELLKFFKNVFLSQVESKVTVSIEPNEKHCKIISILVQKYFPKDLDNIEVDIVKGSRKHLNVVKDLVWVEERKSILSQKQDSSEEVVLLEEDNTIIEGVSSNFFVVKKDGTIETEDKNILFGSMRGICLKECEKMNLKVVFKSPSIKEIDDWKECFLTSTSRFVLPIKRLFVDRKEFKVFKNSEISKKLRSLVIKNTEKTTTKIKF